MQMSTALEQFMIDVFYDFELDEGQSMPILNQFTIEFHRMCVAMKWLKKCHIEIIDGATLECKLCTNA